MAKHIVLSDGEWKLNETFVGEPSDDARRYGRSDAG